jgi:hypothetical protein
MEGLMTAKLKVVGAKPEFLVERFESNHLSERLDELSREAQTLFHALYGIKYLSTDESLQGPADLAQRLQQGLDLLADEVRS